MQNNPAQIFQSTLKQSVSCVGIGVHSGERIRLTLSPKKKTDPPGITFLRTDCDGVAVPARWDYVVDTRFCTTLGVGKVTFSTVEHLLAALWAKKIDHVYAEVTGPELPIMDGSALPFVQMIEQAGLDYFSKVRSFIRVLKPVRVQRDDQWLQIVPADTFQVSVSVPLGCGIAEQAYVYHEAQDFSESIALARTFSLLQNVEKMRAAGLIQGGSLENALVLDENGSALNPEGMRIPHECARHKILDIIGDMALAGAPLLGHIEGFKPGHTLNYSLLKALLSDSTAWRYDTDWGLSSVNSFFHPVAVLSACAYNG